jgi:hypothetical protein
MADNYGTLDAAAAYHTARGNAAWATSTDPLRSAALVRASVWIDGNYGLRFSGKKSGGRSQSRAWPRAGAVDAECNEIPDDEIPVEVLNATFEAALRELATPGSLSPDYVASERVTSEQVGDLKVTYSDRIMAAGEMRPVATVIDDILSSLIAPVREVLFGSAARG